MVLSHVMMSPAGTTIACCLVSCLPLRVAGHSSSEVLSLQSSPWLKNLEIVVNFLFVKEQSSVRFFGRREKINTYSKVVHENQNGKTCHTVRPVCCVPITELRLYISHFADLLNFPVTNYHLMMLEGPELILAIVW
jgi:hypothetical protein